MKKYICMLLIVFITFPSIVNAKTVPYCIKDNCAYNDTCGAWNITYDEKNTNFNLSLAANAVRNGQSSYSISTATGNAQVDFDAKRYAFKCTQDGLNFNTCPSSANKELIDDLLNKYLFDKNKNNNFNITFNNGNFTVQIADKSKFYEKFVFVNAGTISNSNNQNVEASYIDTSKTLNFSNPNILSKTMVTMANGDVVEGYKINNVSGVIKGGNKLLIEVYEKSGGCQGFMVGAFLIDIPALDTINVSNPAISSPDYYGCNLVLNYSPAGMSDKELGDLVDLKKSYIPECYNEQIKYTERNNLKATISIKYGKLQELFKYYNAAAPTTEIVCNEEKTQSKFVKYIKKNYWAATVSEEYSAKGDSAKLVKAGDGFEYQTEYSVTRFVTIIQISEPSMPDQCETSYGHICYWPGGSGSDGGPNEDFDSCILKCDNGKYTQKCINSCYSNVYGVDRNLSFVDKFSYSEQKNNISRMSGCTTDHGNSGTLVDHGDDDYCVSEYCEENGWCDEWEDTGPAGCSDDPQADYDAQVADANSELQALLAEVNVNMTSTDYVGNYTYKITDTYLETTDGQKYVFAVDNTNNPKLGVQTDAPQVLDSAIGSPTYDSSYTFKTFEKKKVNIIVNLPLSAVSKVTGEAVYQTSLEDDFAFSINSKNNTLKKITGINLTGYYNKGERKYYTNLWSENYNIEATCDDKGKVVQLASNGNENIKVTSSNVGEGDFSSNIKCYYGVYNNYFVSEDDVLKCPGPDSDPTPDPDPTGIQYIYRPIDLSDMFPNGRDPRWNWTGTVNTSNNTSTNAALTRDESFYADAVNPQAVIESIESKGESIYDVSRDPSEVDYEFVLTKENIRNIRKYNKSVRDYNGDGENNYLDYNMSCYKNSKGYEVCTSRFMDNINGNSGSDSTGNFVTYSVSNFNITSRKNLAGCNNAKNRECFTISR